MRHYISQSFNSKAMLTLVTSVLRRPNLIVPHISVPTISTIDFTGLRDHCGVRAIIFDKDNTLTAPYDMKIHSKAVWGVEEALRVFGKENVSILSNSAGTVGEDHEMNEARQTELALGIPVIRHKEKKPSGRVIEEVMAHFSQNDELILNPWEFAIIGDRLLTDIVFGNMHGMFTIHCQALCSGDENTGDNLMAKMVRTVENKILYGNWYGHRLRKNRIKHRVWNGDETSLMIK